MEQIRGLPSDAIIETLAQAAACSVVDIPRNKEGNEQHRLKQIKAWLLYLGFSPDVITAFSSDNKDILISFFDADSMRSISISDNQRSFLAQIDSTINNIKIERPTQSQYSWLFDMDGDRYTLSGFADSMICLTFAYHSLKSESEIGVCVEETPTDIGFVGQVNPAGYKTDTKTIGFEVGDIFIQEILQLMNRSSRANLIEEVTNLLHRKRTKNPMYEKLLQIFTDDYFISTVTRKGGDEANILFGVDFNKQELILNDYEFLTVSELFKVLGVKIVYNLNQYIKDAGFKIPINRNSSFLEFEKWFDEFKEITPYVKIDCD